MRKSYGNGKKNQNFNIGHRVLHAFFSFAEIVDKCKRSDKSSKRWIMRTTDDPLIVNQLHAVAFE